MERGTTRRNVLKTLGAAAATPLGMGRGAADSTVHDDTDDEDEFELSGSRNIVIDLETVDTHDIMYSDVETLLYPHEDDSPGGTGVYEVEVTFNTDMEFYRWAPDEWFAAYDLEQLDRGGDWTMVFSRYDAHTNMDDDAYDDKQFYPFESVFFNEWFEAVAQLERIFNGETELGTEELGLDDRVPPSVETMEPLGYRLQVHGADEGRYYLDVPGEYVTDRYEPTQEDVENWTEVINNPVYVQEGRRLTPDN